MSSDDDVEMPELTVINSRSGAAFEAGRGLPRAERCEGVDVVDAREPERGRAGSSSGTGGGQQRLHQLLAPRSAILAIYCASYAVRGVQYRVRARRSPTSPWCAPSPALCA